MENVDLDRDVAKVPVVVKEDAVTDLINVVGAKLHFHGNNNKAAAQADEDKEDAIDVDAGKKGMRIVSSAYPVALSAIKVEERFNRTCKNRKGEANIAKGEKEVINEAN